MAGRVRVAGDLWHGRVPGGAVYVGRQAPGLARSPWANPHRVGPCRVCGVVHDRDGAVRAYAVDLEQDPALVARARVELAGRDLACWCRLDVACHADVLLAVAGAPARCARNTEGTGREVDVPAGKGTSGPWPVGL